MDILLSTILQYMDNGHLVMPPSGQAANNYFKSAHTFPPYQNGRKYSNSNSYKITIHIKRRQDEF